MQITTKTQTVLRAMRFISWLALIGFFIQAGVITVFFITGLQGPENAEKFYNDMNLSGLREYSVLHYSIFCILLVMISLLKGTVWIMVVRILSRINLENPFTMSVTQKLWQVSFLLLAVWGVMIAGNAHANYIYYETGVFYGEKSTGAYLFMAGLLFVISQVFKRGVELQSENELTV